MKVWRMLILVLLLTGLCALAQAEEIWTATDLSPATADMPLAQEITSEVFINGRKDSYKLNTMIDGRYGTFWESQYYEDSHQLRITPPEGKPAGGLVIKWRSQEPLPVYVQVRDENGAWTTVAEGGGQFFIEYIPLPGVTEEFRIVGTEPTRQLRLCEFQLYTVGRLPKEVQLWHSPPDKVDMLLIVAHPDDEVLWFGGMLPTYAGEQKKDVLVAVSSYRVYNRKLELLDALWTCGVRIHPLVLSLPDMSVDSVWEVLDFWGHPAWEKVAGLLRCYKPDVFVMQDVNGEYGHSVHKAIVQVSMESVEKAADPAYLPEAAEQYGLWDVPKVYIHLYQENQIRMDWSKPLAAFGGKTGLEVATEALACHASQLDRWSMEAGTEYDNTLFGLWKTNVGPDTAGDDLFENIP